MKKWILLKTKTFSSSDFLMLNEFLFVFLNSSELALLPHILVVCNILHPQLKGGLHFRCSTVFDEIMKFNRAHGDSEQETMTLKTTIAELYSKKYFITSKKEHVVIRTIAVPLNSNLFPINIQGFHQWLPPRSIQEKLRQKVIKIDSADYELLYMRNSATFSDVINHSCCHILKEVERRIQTKIIKRPFRTIEKIIIHLNIIDNDKNIRVIILCSFVESIPHLSG
ncbi:hypothetical protein Bhyg_09840 [Pseudolycoriella hygida]|uniref:Uncharacterized protein n=1 Tax=Pseudolycoriella hygida TaxID=35572 RepID=A0A9Q0MU05_9DIPT|nr:hypothetical protein Bhyg_09840 [Pseudolycoriella hygida]